MRARFVDGPDNEALSIDLSFCSGNRAMHLCLSSRCIRPTRLGTPIHDDGIVSLCLAAKADLRLCSSSGGN
eukprot:2520129-Karenia_brevis.AAC.1